MCIRDRANAKKIQADLKRKMKADAKAAAKTTKAPKVIQSVSLSPCMQLRLATELESCVHAMIDFFH